MNHFFFELKEMESDGTFKGIASAYGAEDLGGDVIEKGAFTKTIQENDTIPVLWQHRAAEVIGMGQVKEWQGKIMISGQLDMEDPIAQNAFRKMKKGMVRGLSIGYQTLKSFWEDSAGKSIRHITELKLFEVSLVTFPMLPAAQVTAVKDNDELKARLARVEDELLALKATKGTPTGAAAGQAAATPPAEPVEDHSQVISMIEDIRSMIRQ